MGLFLYRELFLSIYGAWADHNRDDTERYDSRRNDRYNPPASYGQPNTYNQFNNYNYHPNVTRDDEDHARQGSDDNGQFGRGRRQESSRRFVDNDDSDTITPPHKTRLVAQQALLQPAHPHYDASNTSIKPGPIEFHVVVNLSPQVPVQPQVVEAPPPLLPPLPDKNASGWITPPTVVGGAFGALLLVGAGVGVGSLLSRDRKNRRELEQAQRTPHVPTPSGPLPTPRTEGGRVPGQEAQQPRARQGRQALVPPRVPSDGAPRSRETREARLNLIVEKLLRSKPMTRKEYNAHIKQQTEASDSLHATVSLSEVEYILKKLQEMGRNLDAVGIAKTLSSQQPPADGKERQYIISHRTRLTYTGSRKDGYFTAVAQDILHS